MAKLWREVVPWSYYSSPLYFISTQGTNEETSYHIYHAPFSPFSEL